MVELLLIEGCDIHIAALMIGVATAASIALDAPVHSDVLRDVLSDGFVALQAKLVLGLLVKAHMALVTFAFNLGVALNKFAGAERTFQLAEGRQSRKQHDGDEHSHRIRFCCSI